MVTSKRGIQGGGGGWGAGKVSNAPDTITSPSYSLLQYHSTEPSETTPLVAATGAAASVMGDGKDLQRLKSYQWWAYFVTFGAYFMAHFSRKCYSTVKPQLKTEAGLNQVREGRLTALLRL